MLLETNHPYYCSDSNYYSNDASQYYESVTDFLDDFDGADVDMNYCFRFDIHQELDDDDAPVAGKYRAEFFIMLQRKGIFKPIYCSSYNPVSEGERLENYLKKHFENTKALWSEFITPEKQQ